jgi:hypothetical protein
VYSGTSGVPGSKQEKRKKEKKNKVETKAALETPTRLLQKHYTTLLQEPQVFRPSALHKWRMMVLLCLHGH